MALIEAIKDGTSEQGPCSLDANGNLKVVATGLDLGNVTITGGGDASAANQVAGNITLAAISAGVGDPDDAAAASDTATATHVSLIKRLLQRTTTLIGLLPTALTANGNLKVAVLEGGTAGGSTELKQDSIITLVNSLIALIGEVQTTPTNNTLLSRLKAIADKTPTLGTQAIASSQSVTPATASTWTVTGPLTDTQLRAAAVPVSGPLTDTQLRAAAVPVSGPLTDTQLRAAAVPVSGPLTDTQLRAAAVPVSGPLTDVQLRATAVPVSLSNAATATLQQALIDTITTGGIVVREKTFTVSATFTRAASTAAYAVNNAINATTAANLTFSNVGDTNGQQIVITGITVDYAGTFTTSIPAYYLFVSPTTFTTTADHSALSLTNAERSGGQFIQIGETLVVPGGCVVQASNLYIPMTLGGASTSLIGLLIASVPFTPPAANGDFVIKISGRRG